MLKLSLLGKPVVSQVTAVGEAEVAALNTNKTLALLCYLATVQEPCSRHMLAGLFWGEDSDTKAKNSLRVALSNLKKLLPDHLEISRLTVAFKHTSPYSLDTEEFERRMDALATNDSVPDIEDLRTTLALYRGEFLEDFYIDGAPEFEEWVLSEREHWRQIALDGFKTLSTEQMATRAYPAAAETLQRVLTLEPWDEEAHRQLMIAHSRTGNFNAALAQYNLCVEQLAEELDVPPMPETEALYARIASARAARQHNLPQEEPPLVGRENELDQIQRALLDPARRLVTVTGFGGIGKTRLAIAAAHTANTEQAINFLHGVLFSSLAGVSSAETFPLVLAETLELNLSGRSTPATQIVDHLRQREMLLVLDNFEHLLDAADLLAQIIQRCPDVKLLVTSRQPLNLEGEWRIDLEGLAYPKTILYQSKDAMAYAAVQLWLQSAIQLEPAYSLTNNTSINNTSIGNEETASVSRLCALVAGSPLAIKLAARWLRLMSTHEIVTEIQQNIDMLSAEMRNWPQRQRSMRAIFDYTYASLGEREQLVFRRVSVFRGGFTANAARDVAGASPFALADLVDRGLIQAQKDGNNSRYVVHELTRQYAEQQSSDTEREQLANAHSRYYASLVNAHREQIFRAQYRLAIDEILVNLDNIRAAWQWLVGSIRQQRDVDLTLAWWNQFVPTLTPFFDLQGMYIAGKQIFNTATEAMQDAGWDYTAIVESTSTAPTVGHRANGHQNNGNTEHSQTEHSSTRQGYTAFSSADSTHENAYHRSLAFARAKVHLAQFCTRLGEYDQTMNLLNTALPHLEQNGEKEDVAYALKVKGRCNFRMGNWPKAEKELQQSAALFREINDLHGVADVVLLMGQVFSAIGDYGLAQDYYKEAHSLDAQLGYVPGKVRALCNLGTTYSRQYLYDQALPLYQESLAMAEMDNISTFIMVNTSNIGGVYTGVGQYDLGEQYYQRSLQMARETLNRRWIAANLTGLAKNYLAQHKLDLAARSADEGLRLAHALNNLPDGLGCLSALAHVWAQRGLIEDALLALLYVEEHPAVMERDQRYNHQLLYELLDEFPEDLIEQIRARIPTLTLDYFLTVGL